MLDLLRSRFCMVLQMEANYYDLYMVNRGRSREMLADWKHRQGVCRNKNF
jgi:hypothetical protein